VVVAVVVLIGQNSTENGYPQVYIHQDGLSARVVRRGWVTLPVSDRIPLLTINAILQTAYLKSYKKPISLILLGQAGIGKSRLFIPLAKEKCVSYVNDITPKYLVEFLEKVKREEKKFLAIPDFVHCMSHSRL
jgi:hypothetical protein